MCLSAHGTLLQTMNGLCVCGSVCVWLCVVQGGTMRLGARRTLLQTMNCMSAKLYQREAYVDERHRHRWVRVWGDGGGRGISEA